MKSTITLRTIWNLALGLGVVLVVAIAWAWEQSPLAEGFAMVTSNPWGWVTLLDLYIGLALALGWIALTLRRPLAVLGWAAALLLLGNLGTVLFLLWRVRRVADLSELLTGRTSMPRQAEHLYSEPKEKS